MILGVVKTIWNALFDFVDSIFNVDIIFYVGIGFLLLMAIFCFIRTRVSYEYKLEKTADRLNAWLYRNQNITDQNLVEFNNIMKEKRTPKILRKYWQQYMLYRDKAPSEYMSTYNCIDKPIKTNSFNSSVNNFKMIYKLTALMTFFFSLFYYSEKTGTFATHLTLSLVTSSIILLVGVILTLCLKAMQSYNAATLYQTFSIFNRYIDRACATMPKYVDFEILFTKKEIKAGIPILGEYLEKRARQEQEELEEAQRNAIAHEEYHFADAGIDGSLVLDRAMKESETYMNIKQRLLSEIQQFEAEISTLKKNYENTSKDYQRKLQASKENMERLRQQQEESTNRVEVNYIRKQQQDEIKKQEILEKDQEDATNKFNAEINSLSAEIEKRRADLEIKKQNVQVAMESEYQTFSAKLYKAISAQIDKAKNDSIQEIVNEKNQYAQAVAYLKDELDSKNAQLAQKDETIADLANKFQEMAMNQEKVAIAEETAVEEMSQENATEEAPEGHYDDRGYYWFNNGTYYDAENLYHDLEGNVYDDQGNLLKSGQPVEKDLKAENVEQLQEIAQQEEAQVDPEIEPDKQEDIQVEENVDAELKEDAKEDLQPIEEHPQINEGVANNEIEPVQDFADLFSSEEQVAEQVENGEDQAVSPENDLTEIENIDANVQNDKEETNPEEMGIAFADIFGDLKIDEVTDQVAEPKQEKEEPANVAEEQIQELVETQANQPQESQESVPVEEKPKAKRGRPRKEKPAESEAPKRGRGRPRKEKPEVDENPKRGRGRPRKEQPVVASEQTPKRKAGRPRKETAEKLEPVPAKRRAGRPKKVQEEQTEQTSKRKAGRPQKEAPANDVTLPPAKRKAGRPKKDTPAEPTPLKRKAGRPRKETAEKTESVPAKRKVGRPKKESTDALKARPKRRAGRPKKADQDQSVALLNEIANAQKAENKGE